MWILSTWVTTKDLTFEEFMLTDAGLQFLYQGGVVGAYKIPTMFTRQERRNFVWRCLKLNVSNANLARSFFWLKKWWSA